MKKGYYFRIFGPFFAFLRPHHTSFPSGAHSGPSVNPWSLWYTINAVTTVSSPFKLKETLLFPHSLPIIFAFLTLHRVGDCWGTTGWIVEWMIPYFLNAGWTSLTRFLVLSILIGEDDLLFSHFWSIFRIFDPLPLLLLCWSAIYMLYMFQYLSWCSNYGFGSHYSFNWRGSLLFSHFIPIYFAFLGLHRLGHCWGTTGWIPGIAFAYYLATGWASFHMFLVASTLVVEDDLIFRFFGVLCRFFGLLLWFLLFLVTIWINIQVLEPSLGLSLLFPWWLVHLSQGKTPYFRFFPPFLTLHMLQVCWSTHGWILLKPFAYLLLAS